MIDDFQALLRHILVTPVRRRRELDIVPFSPPRARPNPHAFQSKPPIVCDRLHGAVRSAWPRG
jgi:hypothetical protein